MTDAHFYVYNAGHGVCTLLTGKRSAGKDVVPYCGIFDCGSRSSHLLYPKFRLLVDMRNKILINSQGCANVHIDDVVISHQDIDHWNQLLDLFFILNGIYLENYNGFLFGDRGRCAWKMEEYNNVYDLYFVKVVEDIEAVTFKFAKKHCTGTYVGNVSIDCDSDKIMTLLKFDLQITDGGFKEATFNVKAEFDEDNVFLLTIGKNGDDIFEHYIPIVPLISVEDLVACISDIIEELNEERWNFPYTLLSIFLNAFKDVAASLTYEVMENLFEDLISENCFQITVPIKRVIMGGSEPKPEYSRLMGLLQGIAEYYGDPTDIPFTWEQYGAYVRMSENYQEHKIVRDFPSYRLFNHTGFIKTGYWDYYSFHIDIIRNLTSTIIEFEIGGRNNELLLPGDVTVHAFETIARQARGLRPGLFLAPHHGSDRTNFYYDDDDDEIPLAKLFKAIIGRKECVTNLVVSGYNSHDLHPGEEFIDYADDYFDLDTSAHLIGYATHKLSCMSSNEDFIMYRIVKTNEIEEAYTQGIYTTNMLPFYDEGYFDYCDGEVAIGDMSNSCLKRKSIRNSLRRLPPDDSFI